MTTLHTLKAPYRSSKRRKRVGRGQGSGLGKTAGRGGKGQKARTGNMRFEGFEGGQMPLQRRAPKFGFNPPNRLRYAVVNTDELAAHYQPGATVDEASLREVGLVKGQCDGIKLLGRGPLSHKLTIRVHRVTAGAKATVQKAGGTVEELPLMVHKPESAAKAHAGKGVAKG